MKLITDEYSLLYGRESECVYEREEGIATLCFLFYVLYVLVVSLTLKAANPRITLQSDCVRKMDN